MKLQMAGQLRMEQKMKLAPHMIQAMEILQLPVLALAERIEQELNSNPVLELQDVSGGDSDENDDVEQVQQDTEGQGDAESGTADDLGAGADAEAGDGAETEADVDEGDTDLDDAAGFEKLESIDDNFDDHFVQADSFRPVRSDQPDPKHEAIKNTAAGPKSLYEYLIEQWNLIDADEPVKKAGIRIIDYIDEKGYLSTRLEQLCRKDKDDFTVEHLQQALKLVQTLEPTGVGARSLQECLLIQIEQSGDDMSFEHQLVSEHMDELLENHLPEIAKKMECDVETINRAIKRLSKLDTSPGLQVSQAVNRPVTADVIVEFDSESGLYRVRLADDKIPSLRLNSYYTNMTRDNKLGKDTRRFLQENIRSAQWIIDAVEQRNNTLLRVAEAVVRHQKDFFEKGALYLKPLPMAKIAEEVGVHIATVSRAVAGKYIQCNQGILPLRKFFSGGTEDTAGNLHSWHAIRTKLQQIIDSEDKIKPLSDEQIRKKLSEAGIGNIARRTVAKYRNILGIAPARLRKKFKQDKPTGKKKKK